MLKKVARSLDELDKKTKPSIVRQAKENAKREKDLDKARLEKLLKVNNVDDKN
jgi:hypothetical protein